MRCRPCGPCANLDRAIQRLRVPPAFPESLPIWSLFDRQRKQQALDGHERIAGLLGDLLGVVEKPSRRRREIKLTCPAALDFGQLGQRQFDLLLRVARTSAARSIRPADRPSGSSSRTFRMCSGMNCWCLPGPPATARIEQSPARARCISRYSFVPPARGRAPKRRDHGDTHD